jgi:hypothetical protein
MKLISLAKIEIVEVEVLQYRLNDFLNSKNESFGNIQVLSNDYFLAIILIENAKSLFLNFRSKVEKHNKRICTINLTCTEAVVLLQVCCFFENSSVGYEKHTLLKIKNHIFNQFVNL